MAHEVYPRVNSWTHCTAIQSPHRLVIWCAYGGYRSIHKTFQKPHTGTARWITAMGWALWLEQYAVSIGRGTLLMRGVKPLGPRVIFISRWKCDRPFFKLPEYWAWEHSKAWLIWNSIIHHFAIFQILNSTYFPRTKNSSNLPGYLKKIDNL
jgi:hypothetical protein